MKSIALGSKNMYNKLSGVLTYIVDTFKFGRNSPNFFYIWYNMNVSYIHMVVNKNTQIK